MGRIAIQRRQRIHHVAAAVEPLEGRTLLSTSNLSLGGTLSSGSVTIIGGGVVTTPIVESARIADLTDVGETLYFSVNGRRVWRSDGTTAGTREVASFAGFAGLFGSPAVGEFTDFAGTLFFAGSNGAGTGLWRTDGTAAGTRLVKNAMLGMESLNPTQLTVIGRWLYFTSNGALWKTDGTTNGTTSLGVSAGAIKAVGDTLYFIDGTELWKTDGTPGVAVRLADSLPRNYSWTRVLTAGDGKFFALFRDQQTSTMALWSSDGTAGGTREVAIVRYDPSKNASGDTEERWDDTAVLWGRMFFNGITSRGKHAVYVTDGTTAGTSVFALQTRPDGLPVELETIGGRLFFGRFTGLRGDEWWVTNGKASNTSLVATHALSSRAYPSALIGFNDAAYFASVNDPSALTGSNTGRGIFRSDGTPAGTAVVLKNWLSSGHPKSAATRDAVFFMNDDASQLAAIDADGKATIITPMAPVATLDARDTAAAPGLTYTFRVTYQHHDPAAAGAFDTLDHTNVYVTGPNGYAAYARFVEVDWGSSGPRTAVYAMQPPGGSWNNLDKGTYWAWMRPDAVKDAAGYVPAGPLGSFLVRPVTGTTGNVTGVVFRDLDSDGFVDPGETTHEGFRVWVDLNNDGAFQAGEPNARSDAGGRYDMANVPAGDVHLRQTFVEGWEFTSPHQVVRIFPGGSAEANFNARYEPHNGTIFGTIFYDTNGNGARNTGEGVLKGFTVYLDRDNDQQFDADEPKAVTGPDGGYSFTGLDGGTYRLRQVIVGGDWKMSTVAGVTITLPPGGADTASFGNFILGTGEVSGSVVTDTNGNGSRDYSESSDSGAIARLRRVFLDANLNGRWDDGEPFTRVDGYGKFSLRGLLAGANRIVCELADAGWIATSPAEVDIQMKSGGNVQLTFFQSQKALIAGYVFDDRNRDGQAVPGEEMLAGWRVYLDENLNGQHDDGERASMTDATGRYEFAGLFTREYSLGLTGTGEWLAVTPSYVTVKTSGGRTRNQHFAVARGGVIKGAALRRVPNSNDRPEPNLVVYVDANDNGALDIGEISTRSQYNGTWLIGGLSAGTYVIRALGGNPAVRRIALAANQTRSLVYFWVN
jgi:ELWxxDGT repeat protein